MLLLAICLAFITKASKGNGTVSVRETGSYDDSLVVNVDHTLGVCTEIVQAVNDFRDDYLTSNDLRRLSDGEEIDDEDLVLSLKDKLDTCVSIVEAVDAFRKDYNAIGAPEIDAPKKDGQDTLPEEIVLNVGGKRFTTSLTTIRSIKGTFLEEMFREGSNTTISADGSYFIDRDPCTFGYVLDYLRSGDLLVKSDDSNIRMQVLDDAVFFKLPNDLKDYLRWSPLEGIDLWFSEVNFINKQLKRVSKEMGGLLYQAAKDGFGVSSFHGRTHGKGSSVTIVETKSGNVFGGYSYTSWYNSGSWRTSPGSFLFRLRPSMKVYDLKSSHKSYAIYTHGSYGPMFGNGHDLYIINCRDVATCSTREAAYNMPSTYDLNDGERFFRIKDYAVVQAKSL